MKLFAITQSSGGVHIQKTDNNRPPRQVIIAEADTYEEAVTIRDEQRAAVENARSEATDRWHDKWRKAEERGDMQELHRLAGIK